MKLIGINICFSKHQTFFDLKPESTSLFPKKFGNGFFLLQVNIQAGFKFQKDFVSLL